MSVCAWRELPLFLPLARAGARLGIAGLLLLGANSSLQNAIAEGDTRTLSFHHTHTGEDITITFKRDGRYDEAALAKLNWFMRDWRKEKETRMDPQLFDLLWEAYRDLGATQPIQVICGYRSPETNSMLRRRSKASGVAEFSQHINGNAMDFFIPGVPLASIRAEGLRLQRGGVGFYPTSGSPFVHMDTGSIRHWPRIARAELAKIFPDGRTVHIPADGHPMSGYALALADVERNGATVSPTSLNAARAAGAITAGQEQAAERPHKSLLAGLFGSLSGHQDTSSEPAQTVVASAVPAKPVAVERVAPSAAARSKPADSAVALPRPRPAQQPIVTASVANTRFDDRGYWRGSIDSQAPALPQAIASGTAYQTASLDPAHTGTASQALAYASAADLPLHTARARPMGSPAAPARPEASVLQSSTNSSIAWKAGVTPVGGPARTDSPWLRAAMLTPSVTGFLSTSRIDEIDPRWQHELLRKPDQSVLMIFSGDPHLGLTTDRFTGSAVVFVATTTFAAPRTAWLPLETTGSLH